MHTRCRGHSSTAAQPYWNIAGLAVQVLLAMKSSGNTVIASSNVFAEVSIQQL